MNSALETEMATFRRELPGLLADPAKLGQYVLIHGETVAGVYPTQAEAIRAGYDTFGLVPFLAKHIVEREEVYFFPRSLTRCPSSQEQSIGMER